MRLDLTDTWHGRFTYPRRYQPVSFVANITQTGQCLSGTSKEKGFRGAVDGKLLTATLNGRLTGSSVVFLKIYDVQAEGYSAVQYEGEIADQGLEISGRWTIARSWSGTFIMIRSGGLPTAISMRKKERV